MPARVYMDVTLFWQIILQIILIFCNAVFACAEIAVLSVSEARLSKARDAGDRRAVRLLRLTANPARFLATIQVGITFAGFLGSAFAADNFSEYLTDWLAPLLPNLPAKTLDTIAVIVVTLVLSYLTLIFGELVPKRLAMRSAEKVAFGMSGLITGVAAAFRPVVWLLTVSTNGVLRLFGVDPNAKVESATEEDIRLLVDEGGAKGTIEPGEHRMIQNVFEFGDRTVKSVMTHRTKTVFLYSDDTDAEWQATVVGGHKLAYPVCGKQPDDVLGVLRTDDYLRLDNRARENVMAAVRPARFVFESARADDVFRDMRRERDPFAIVVDEFGGVSGVVTLGDLRELIVGEDA